MQKNVASQKIGAQLVSASDGSAFTGSVTCYVTGDAGTQATGSVGSGICTHEGNGYHTYTPAQAETNYDLVAFTYTGTGAVPATIQVYTSVAVNAIGSGVITATSIASDAFTAAKFASDVTTELQTGLATASALTTVSGKIDTIDDFLDTEIAAIKTKTDFLPSATAGTNGGLPTVNASNYVAGIAGTLNTLDALDTAQDTQHSTTQGRLPATLVSGRMDSSVGAMASGVLTATAIAADAITAAKVAADVTTEIQTGLATASALATVSGKIDTIDDLLDTEVAAIKAVTDKLDTAVELDGSDYRFTTNALELAPTGGSAPSAATIADAVWDEVQSGHVTAGTFGKYLDAAVSSIVAGDGGGPIANIPVAEEFTAVLTTRRSVESAGEKRFYVQSTEKVMAAIDFANLLHAGDSLASITSITEGTSQSITLDPIGICGTQAKFYIESVLPNVTYRAECKVVTRFGLIMEGDVIIVAAD